MIQLPFSVEQIETFLLIFIRVGAIIFSVPLFSSNDIPKMVKAGLSICIAWIIFPAVFVPRELHSFNIFQFLPSVAAEVLIGILIGLTARIVFEGIQLGGQLVGHQMGFGIANVLDPVSGANFSIISQVQNIIATLIFIALNMHHWFIKAIALSFTKIPLLHCFVGPKLVNEILGLGSTIFIVGIKVSAPIMAVVLFSEVAFGLLNKAAPLMHIFILSFPLKIASGLFILGITLPMFYIVIKDTFPVYLDYIDMIFMFGVKS